MVGSCNYDVIAYVERRPEPGDSVRARGIRLDCGGKGFNQAVALRRLGAEVEMCGAVGEDWFGGEFRRRLDELGIGRRFLKSVERLTGIAMPVVDAAGENAIVHALGANLELTPDDVQPAAFSGADAVLLQGELRAETTARAAELGRSMDRLVVLNLAPADPSLRGALHDADVAVVNRAEAAQLGGPGQLLAAGVDAVVVTMGAGGAEIHAQRPETVAAPEVEVVDTTGAGDAFAAALTLALVEGRSLQEAAAWAAAAGAAACMREGTSSAMPARDEVEELFRRR